MNPLNTVVVAGAGTGKTYRLVHEYLWALLGLDGSGKAKNPRRVLAVTFTEKAAAEMRIRITKRLLLLLENGSYDDELKERARALSAEPCSLEQVKTFARQVVSAPITTFHAYCARLLREHALAAGIDTDYVLLNPDDERKLTYRVAEDVVLEALEQNNPHVSRLVARFQLRRLQESKGLVQLLSDVLQQCLEHGADIERLQLATKHGAAALDPKQSWDDMICNIARALDAFEKPSAKTTERLQHIASCLAAFKQALADTDDDKEVRLSRAFQDLRFAVKGRFGSNEARQLLVGHILELGSVLVDSFTLPEADTFRRLLTTVFERVMQRKHELASYGFVDLLVLTRKLLRENIEVRRQVKRGLDKILVDEFQDTSPLQEDIVALLSETLEEEQTLAAGERAMGAIKIGQHRLFIVGDPKQSIYHFRGADARLFEHTLQVVTANEGQRVSLQVCRRSQAAIVQIVNAVALATLPIGSDGVPVGAGDVLEAMRPKEEKAGAIWQVELREDESKEYAAARVAAEQIAQIVQNRPASDVAVLVRRIKAARPIVNALAAKGIPAQIHGGEGFWGREEISDILATLMLVLDGKNEIATLTVLRSPLVGLQDTEIVSLVAAVPRWHHGLTWHMIETHGHQAKISPESKIAIERFSRLLQDLQHQVKRLSLQGLVQEILRFGYIEALATCEDFEQRLANVEKLGMMYADSRQDAAVLIQKLWQLLDNPPKESLAEISDGKPAVHLMTIHQSKGLEFPVVVVADTASTDPNETDDALFDMDVGLALNHRGRPIAALAPATGDEKKLFPCAIDVVRQRRRQRTQAELARVLYVALTRARDELYFVEVLKEGKPIDRGMCLRRLFAGAKSENAALFEQLMPSMLVENFSFPPILPEKKTCQLGQKISVDKKPFSVIPLLQDKESKDVSSQLLRRVLCHVGQFITSSLLNNEESLRQFLAAALRQEGGGDESIIDKCLYTLTHSMKNLFQIGTAYFTQHVALEHESGRYEGVLDVLVETKDTVYLIQFSDESLPLLAGAMAFQHSGKKILMASHAIGSNTNLKFHLQTTILEHASIQANHAPASWGYVA